MLIGRRKILVAGACLLAAVAARVQGKEVARKRKGPSQPPVAPVPYQKADVIMGRPTVNSVVFSLLRYDQNTSATLHYGVRQDELNNQITVDLKKDKPLELKVDALEANTRYYFVLRDIQTRDILARGAFHTQRPKDSEFTFTITADSHLDNNADPTFYQQTLANVRGDQPDFHIDLGDTFMTGKHANRANAADQYLAQRYYFSQLTTPLFLVLGNHDGESSSQRRGGEKSLAAWANQMRTCYFPNPKPDDFYTGNNRVEADTGELLQDYYSWTWGDALYVVLNPYWQADPSKKSSRWHLSLGDTQYRWLQNTLETSQAKYKLVFVHQLIGGLDRQGRGGVEAIPYGEWGGYNADDSKGFAKNRPGWEMPIHDLLVKYGVNAVFHGHDHLFAMQQQDGIVYQEVPQPAHRSFKLPRNTQEYGYLSGTILGGSGHLRIRVSSESIKAEFVRVDVPGEGQTNYNGEILHHYQIQPK